MEFDSRVAGILVVSLKFLKGPISGIEKVSSGPDAQRSKRAMKPESWTLLEATVTVILQ
jgi:hypothetical protein